MDHTTEFLSLRREGLSLRSLRRASRSPYWANPWMVVGFEGLESWSWWRLFILEKQKKAKEKRRVKGVGRVRWECFPSRVKRSSTQNVNSGRRISSSSSSPFLNFRLYIDIMHYYWFLPIFRGGLYYPKKKNDK